MNDDPSWAFVVDDDDSVRRALERLLRTAGIQVKAFSSATEFLAFQRPEAPSCLVLDLQLPGLDGLQLQESLKAQQGVLPIVFISGHGDVPTSVRAMKAGAVDFLPKPFSDEELLTAVRQAIEADSRARTQTINSSAIRQRFETLSPREQQVLAYVVGGMLNKQIARRLGITEKTVKVHRGQAMRKMQCRSLAELVRYAEKLGIDGPPPAVQGIPHAGEVLQ